MNALPILASALLAQTIYSWTDASGVVHYTDQLASVPRAAKATASLGPTTPTLKLSESSLLRSFDRAHWRTSVPACAKALHHADERRLALKTAEEQLIELTRLYEPCQRYLDICWSRNLSRSTWQRECRERPKRCDLPVAEQRAAVVDLREEVDALPEWLERMGVWGCVN
jgi:hypothetical protein